MGCEGFTSLMWKLIEEHYLNACFPNKVNCDELISILQIH